MEQVGDFDMRKIITICREFGSGGREVGKRVAEILQVPYYDNEIVTELAKRTEFAEEYISRFSEKRIEPVVYPPITIGRSLHAARGYFQPVSQKMSQNMNIHIEQGKLLREYATASDCVIVGRCANHILKDMDPLRVFVYADMDSKIRRCLEKTPENEKLTEKELVRHIKEVDKSRAAYYKAITGEEWGKKIDYDIMINTTYYSIKLVSKIIAQKILFGDEE